MLFKSRTYWRRPPCYLPLTVSNAIFGLFFVIALLPVVLTMSRSLSSGSGISFTHYQSLLGDGRILILLLKSSTMALDATILSFLFGLPFAIFLTRYMFRFRWVATLFCLVPLFIPSHVHALAWISLLGKDGIIQTGLIRFFELPTPLFGLYSPFGAAFLLFLTYCPIIIVTAAAGLLQIDRKLEEAAAFHAKPLRVWLQIILPLLYPYLFAGGVVVFIFSFFNYGVPSMLRVPSFPVEILTQFSAFYDEAGAAALATPIVVVAAVLLFAQSRLLGRCSFFTIDGSAVTGAICNNTKTGLKGYAAFYIWGFVLVTVALPLLALVIQSGTLRSFAVAWNGSAREIGISLALAFSAATLGTILAYFLARGLVDSSPQWECLLNMSTLLPLAFPAPLLGIGLIFLWNRAETSFIYSGPTILIIAWIARFIPFGIKILQANIQQLNPSMREAACLHQTSRLKRLFFIELPLIKRGLMMSWVVIFIFSMGELGTTLLVIPPGLGTLSLKIYTLMHYGSGPLVAALAIILITLNFLCSGAIVKAARWNTP